MALSAIWLTSNPALYLQAEQKGLLAPDSGDTIYEGTSGSTGISLATLARAKGYLAHMCALRPYSINS